MDQIVSEVGGGRSLDPVLFAVCVLEAPIKRSRRRSIDQGLASEGFTLYKSATEANVLNQLIGLRKPGFHGLWSVVALREAAGALQIAAEFEREERFGRHSATVHYSVVAVECPGNWEPTVVYRLSWLDWEQGAPFSRRKAPWMTGFFRFRMIVEPVDGPPPAFLNGRLRRWLAWSSARRRDHWSVLSGTLLYCTRGRLTPKQVHAMLRRCERFKELAAREAW